MESNTGSEMEDVRAVANRDHQAGTGVELSFKQGPPPHQMRFINKVNCRSAAISVPQTGLPLVHGPPSGRGRQSWSVKSKLGTRRFLQILLSFCSRLTSCCLPGCHCKYWRIASLSMLEKYINYVCFYYFADTSTV